MKEGTSGLDMRLHPRVDGRLAAGEMLDADIDERDIYSVHGIRIGPE